MEERQGIEAHPVKELIGHLLEEGAPGEGPYVLRPEAQQILEQAIDEVAKSGSAELMFIAQTIFSVADWLEEHHAPATAEILCAILDRPNVIGAMQMINEATRTQLGAVEHGTPGDEFASFASKETNRRAPTVGEVAPDDAVKLNSLSFPKRL